MRATGKGHRSCWIHTSLVRPPTQLPDQQFVRTWNQARDQGGPVGYRDWVSSPVQAKGEAGDGGVHHDPSPQSFCPCLLGGMSWKKWGALERQFIYLSID